MKKILGVILTASMVMSSFTPVLAEEQNKIKVDRIAGADRYETSAKISQRTFPNHIRTVVLASGENFADSLVAGGLANKENAPVLLTQKEKLPQVIKDEITRLNPEQVIIVGGEKSVNISGLKNAKRLAGANRYETSVKVYNYLNPNGKVALASGLIFADALCATPLSTKENLPIVLTDGHNLPKGITKDKVALIYGGEKSVNVKGLEETRRLAGADRYETALIIAKEYGNLEKFVLADGRNYPDALSVSPLAHKNNEPILLTDPSHTEFIKEIVKDNNTKEITVVGGELSISSKQIEEIASVEITEGNKQDTPPATPTPDNPSTPDKPEEKPEESAKEKALKEAKEKAIEELKNNGITSPVYIDQINRAKTVEGVNALKDEIIKAHKKSEEEKIVEFGDAKLKEMLLQSFKKYDGKDDFEKEMNEYNFKLLDKNYRIDPNATELTVKDMEQLQSLGIRSPFDEDFNFIEFKSIKGLEFAKNLETLTISGNPDDSSNSFQDITPLKDLKKLKLLRLSHNAIKDVSPLKDLSSLEKLYISHNKIEDVSPLNNLTNLTQLDFARNKVEDISAIKDLVKLDTFDINGNKIEDISVIKNFPELKFLSAKENKIKDISALKNNLKLEVLYLNQNQIETVDVINNLTKLVDLGLSENKIANFDFSRLMNLKELQLSKNSINDITSLSKLSKLEQLRFSNNKVASLEALKDLKELQMLNASENKIEDLTPIKNLAKLYNLDVHSNPIKDISVAKNLKQLGDVDVSETQITDLTPLKAESIYSLEADKLSTTVSDVKLNGNIVEFDNPFKLIDKVFTKFKEIKSDNPKVKAEVTEDNKIKLTLEDGMTLKDIEGLKLEYSFDSKSYSDPVYSYSIELVNLKDSEAEKPEYVDIEDAKLLKVLNKNLDVNRKDDQRITKQEMESLKEVSIFLDKKTNKPIFTEESKDTYSILGKAQDLSKTKDFKFSVTRGMKSLKGIEYATNLEKLKVNENEISDLTPLKDLKNLKYLEIQRNRIVDVSPLANLKNLEFLKLYNNLIENVEPLKDLTNLTGLDLHNNVKVKKEGEKRINYDGITDISSLKNLTKLTFFDVSANKIENVDIILGMEKINQLDFSDNKIKDYSKLDNYILPRFIKQQEGDGSVGFHGQNVTQTQSVTVDNNKVSFVPEYKGLGNLFNEFAKAFEMEDASALVNVTTNVEGVKATFDVKNDKINLEVTDEFLKSNDGKTVNVNLKIEFAEAYGWNLNDVKLQVKKPEENPTPETPIDEKIAEIQNNTSDKLPAKNAIAKIRVVGQINNIQSDKFIVKLVDEDGKETYPEIEVTGDLSKAFRVLNIKVPENTTDKEKTYEIFVSSTGKKENFKKAEFTLTQEKSSGTPEFEKMFKINSSNKDIVINVNGEEKSQAKKGDTVVVKAKPGKEISVFYVSGLNEAGDPMKVNFKQVGDSYQFTMPESECNLNIITKDKKVAEENIQRIDLESPEKVSKDSSTATVKVMGILSGITNDKFVVKFVDNDGNETFPKVDVSGDVNKNTRIVSFEIPKNATTKEKEYTVYVSSTGSKTDFASATVKITQGKLDSEEQIPEGIMNLELETTDKLDAEGGKVVLKVMGDFKNVSDDKFVVKLVDDKGNETFPQITVIGTGARRTLEFEVGKNEETIEKTYKIYATSTGSHTKFYNESVEIKQNASENTKTTIEKTNVLTPILKNEQEKLKVNIIGENVNPDNLRVSFYRLENGKFVKDDSIRPRFEKSGKFVQIVADSIALIKGNEEDVYKILVRDNNDLSKSYEAYFRVKYTEEKVSYVQIMPGYVHASKDGKIIEVGFDEEIEQIFDSSMKAGISIDKNADGKYERLTNGDTVELSDKKFVITLEKPLDVENLGTKKAKIKIDQGVFRSKGTENLNSDVDYFINIGKPIVRQASIEGNDVITNKNRKVTIKVNGMNLSENAKVKAVMQTKLATEDTDVAKKGKQPEVQGTISGSDNEQTITFELPENKTDRTVSYEILYKPEINGKYEKLPGNNPRSRANSIVISLVADGEEVNAATLAFMKIHTYGATSTDAGQIPDITYGETPTNQESKKTFTHVYGTNLEAKKTRVRIFDDRGVEWYIVNQPSSGAAAFKMVVPGLIGIDGDGNYQRMEIIGPGNLIGDHTFTYKVAVDGKNYDENIVVRANILASGKSNDGKFDLENQETTLKLNYVDEEGKQIKESTIKKSYSFFEECAAGIYPDAIEHYQPIKIIRKSDGKEIQLTDGVDYTDYRNLQTILGVNQIGDNPEYTIVYYEPIKGEKSKTEYKLTLVGDNISTNREGDKIKKGEEVILTFKPEEKHFITKLLVNGKDEVEKVKDNKYTFIMNKDTKIEVTYEKRCELILKGENIKSSVEPSNQIKPGTKIRITVDPDEDKSVSEFLVNGQDLLNQLLNNTYDFYLDKCTTIEVKYTQKSTEPNAAQDFDFDATTGTITDYKPYARKDVIIPEKINGVEVKHIDEYAFYYKGLNSVKIPNTVISIGDLAFNSNNLGKVTIPESVEEIGSSAFKSAGLIKVTLPKNIKKIGKGAFADNKIKEFTIPKNITKIPESLIENNILNNIVIPSTVTEIGTKSFKSNELTDVKFADSVKKIDILAFADNNIKKVELAKDCDVHPLAFDSSVETNLPKKPEKEVSEEKDFVFDKNTQTITEYVGSDLVVKIPRQIGGVDVKAIGGFEDYFGIKKIKVGAFQNKGIMKLTIPEGIETIDESAFKNNLIKEVVLPQSLKTLGKEAFSDNKIEDIITPKNISRLEDGAFKNNNLSSVKLEGKIEYIGSECFMNNKLQNIDLPEGLQSIKDGSFSGNFLTEIKIPESVTEIETGAFYGNQIQTLNISENLKKIGDGAFGYCRIKELLVPENVEVIGKQAFIQNPIEKAEFKGATKILFQAFYTCGLNEVKFADDTDIGVQSFQNNNLKSVVIPKNTKKLAAQAFAQNFLENIELPEGLETIGQGSLYVNHLVNVKIPSTVKTIEDAAFFNNKIEKLDIGLNVKNIGEGAFKKNNLKEVTVSKDAQLGKEAFDETVKIIKN